MPARQLDERFLRTLRLPTERNRDEYFDEKVRGLSIRVSRTGHKTWHFKTKVKGGDRPGYTLGLYPNMTLKEARSAALEIASQAKRGINVREVTEAAKAKQAADAATAQLVEQVLNLYFTNHIDRNLKPNSGEERKRQLAFCFRKVMAERLDQVTPRQLQEVVDSKQAEGKITMANRLRSALKAFLSWAAGRGYVDADLGSNLQRAGRELPRARTPTLDEIREVWKATFSTGDLWGPFFRLCLLTAQRNRGDILSMKWSWIDFERAQYEIPNPKNRQPHIVPLSRQALEELRRHKAAMEQDGEPSKQGRHKIVFGEFVFSTTGIGPAKGVSRAKERLDQGIAANRQETGLCKPFEKWVLHDIRRSFATAMVEHGASEGVTDRILNHVAVSSRPSVSSSVYMKADRLKERAEALQQWADLITDEAPRKGPGRTNQKC
ncbi:MAG: tyrosine-type recombinase/integrase [Paracoccus hibiscisoli]|uniref:tyrosine-type recombinase/integrase n=1 Tax=Paracoccus hibiscisoli TaxID=2023261 RepID=UPI00391C2D6C